MEFECNGCHLPDIRSVAQQEDKRRVENRHVNHTIEKGERSSQVETLEKGSPRKDDSDSVVNEVAGKPGAHGKVEGVERDWVKEGVDGGIDPHLLDETVHPPIL